MPVYTYLCKKCNTKSDRIRSMESAPPLCCNTPMVKQFASPGLLRICDTGGVRIHTKDYKDDYAKQYRESIGIES